jgi:hypothetical protein
LRGVPGPLLARITGLWLFAIDMRGQKSATVHRWHQKYGPIVRIGPNELSFATIDCVKPIYGMASEFKKADWYRKVGPRGVVCIRGIKEHKQRRKQLNHAFFPTYLNELEPVFHKYIRKLTMIIDAHLDEPFDVLRWFRLLALDIVGAFLSASHTSLAYH